MVFVFGIIVRSEVDEHVIIIDWNFPDERGRVTILHLRIEQTWERREMTKITVMPDDNRAGFSYMMYEFLIILSI
jgi:hypothetical protein